MTTNYLPPTVVMTSGTAIENLKTAVAEMGAGGGGLYMKVCDRTGRMTLGQAQDPFPENHKFVVGLHTFAHGYLVMQGTKVVENRLVPMIGHPNRPTSPNGYVEVYGQDGAKNVLQIKLVSIQEPGLDIDFTAWSKSNANRVRDLLQKAVMHDATPEGQAGFKHPVIIPKSNSYPLKGFTNPQTGEVVPARTVHHFDFFARGRYGEIEDWLHVDGSTLLSQHGGAITAEPSSEVAATEKAFGERAADERALWDDDPDDVDLTDPERRDMTDAEREVFSGRS